MFVWGLESCMKRKKAAPTFKAYQQHQLTLLPPSLDDLIPPNHPVRLISEVIDQIDLSKLVASYEGGGCSSYHPAMLLKLLVYGYLRNIYSTRKLEEAVTESIHFMWLAGGNRPDHNTLARFRSQRLKGQVRAVFCQVVELLVASGQLGLQEGFLDGTKIEANANRYTFVWGKAIKTSKERLKRQLQELLDYADTIAANENSPPPDFQAISPELVQDTIARINEALKGHEVDPKVKQKLRYAEKNWPAKLEQYQEQERVLGERNSYSKTDPDATFMRMKDDHMGNGQLKPGYNVQATTENQFITNYTIHPNPADTRTLPQHLAAFKDLYGKVPTTLTADAGYGSEENYECLANEGVTAYVKYHRFHLEQKQGPEPFSADAWDYDREGDFFRCPAGRQLLPVGQKERTTETGYKQQLDQYRSVGCSGCPFRDKCLKGEGDRTIEVSHKLRQHKATARKNLTSDQGVAHRKRRCCEVESVFGHLKHNKGFKRFNLRGKAGVETEFGLLAIAHNLAKALA